MKSCLEEYKNCDADDIAGKYIEGQPQVSAVPVLNEGGTVISGMDTVDKKDRAEGMADGILSAIKNLVKNMGGIC